MILRNVKYISAALGACGLSFACGCAIIAPAGAAAVPGFRSDQYLDPDRHIRTAEEDLFEACLRLNSDRRPPVVHGGAQIAAARETRRLDWSELSDYDKIRDERHAMVRTAENAARARAALKNNPTAAKITASWPGRSNSPESSIQHAKGVVATSHSSNDSGRAPDRARTAPLINRKLANIPVVARSILATVRLQYHAIRNGYRGGGDAPQHASSSPAVFAAASVSAPSRAFCFPPFSVLNHHCAHICTRQLVLNFSGDPV